jgi:hypothetical protein
LAVSALEDFTLVTDGNDVRLPAPVSLLIAANWDLTGMARVFSRDDATGAWTGAELARDHPTPGSLPQVRSLSGHRDRGTGIDRVFAESARHLQRHLRCGCSQPYPLGRRPGARPLRCFSGGIVGSQRLSAGQHFCRMQRPPPRYGGAADLRANRRGGPHWRLVYTNRYPGHSETGLRGLTAIPSPSGHGEVLLAAVEGNAARIVRVDPRDGSETTELGVADFLGQQWGMRANYVIAAYNDMTKVHDPAGGDALLIGLEAFIPLTAPIAAGHNVVNVGYGRLEAGGWYLVRHAARRYDLRQVATPSGRPLVATRSIRASPFPQENEALYFAGYDANKVPAHNTAWIVRSTIAAAIGTAR